MLLGLTFPSYDLINIQRVTPVHSKILSYQKATIRKHVTPKSTARTLTNLYED
jgi:hypothetical protein